MNKSKQKVYDDQTSTNPTYSANKYDKKLIVKESKFLEIETHIIECKSRLAQLNDYILELEEVFKNVIKDSDIYETQDYNTKEQINSKNTKSANKNDNNVKKKNQISILNLNFLKQKIEREAEEMIIEEKKLSEEKEFTIEINNSNNQQLEQVTSYNQVLFNYKNFNHDIRQENLKRKNDHLFDGLTNNKIIKKQNWIVKENNNKIETNNPFKSITLRNDISSNENSCIIPIENKDEDISKLSLSIASNLESKTKFENNFAAIKEKSNFSEFFKNKKETKINEVYSKSKAYDLDIKTIEDDNFYNLKYNQFIPIKKKRNSSPKKMINYRIKKEREKLSGYKCEICQNFYEILGEDFEQHVQSCSRHRNDIDPSSTPKGFYDNDI